MKLNTKMKLDGHGTEYPESDDFMDFYCDAAAAHALVRELNALLREGKRRRTDDGRLVVDLIDTVLVQADRQMVAWGMRSIQLGMQKILWANRGGSPKSKVTP